MKIVRHNNDEEWLQWRREGITASDAAVIAGYSKKPTRGELWLDKVGKGMEREPPNEAMKFGILLEDDICAMYESKSGYRVIEMQVCGEAVDAGFPMRATFDGFTDEGHLIECKAVGIHASRDWPEDGDWENIPYHVFLQVQHQMAVANIDRCDVLAFIPLELRIYPVERNEMVVEQLMWLEKVFWEHVASRTPPEMLVDDSDAELFIKAFGVADKAVGLSLEVQDAADAYENVTSLLKELGQEKDRLRARLLSAMCNHRYGSLPDGRILDCNLIQIAERIQTVKAHQQVRLSIKQPKH